MRPSFWVFAIFILIFSSVYGGAHFYVYRRLALPLLSPGLALRLIQLALVGLFASFPLLHFILRGQDNALGHFANYVSSIWMGVLVYLLLLTAALDLLRLATAWPNGNLFVRFHSVLCHKPGASIGVVLVAVLITVYGLWEACRVGVAELSVRIPSLPSHLEGMRLVQVSDVHMGLIIKGKRLRRIVDITNQLNPDIIVVTGDLVDEQALHMQDMVEPLKLLKSKYGIYAVTGNHEFFVGAERAAAFVGQAGIKMLRNEWVEVTEGLQLVGRDDPAGSRVSGETVPPFSEIMTGIDKTKPIVLLYHTPATTFDELDSLGIDLQLSGHTHQGQLWPFRYIVRMIFDTAYGLYQRDNRTIYVSPGTGTWGPPMRVLAKPEVTLVKLTRGT